MIESKSRAIKRVLLLSVCISQADWTGSRYRGLADCVKTVYAANGIRGFFSGLSVVCVRAFPVNAITFLVYSHALDYLHDSRLLHLSLGSQ